MKTIIRTIIGTQTAALLLSLMPPVAASAATETPFRGTYQAQETTVEEFPMVFVEGNAWGNATHLGRFTATYETEVNLLTLEAFETSHFLAANGDSLSTDAVTLSTTLLGEDLYFIQVVHTITGGTGRFAGASGTFIVEAVLNVATHQRSGQFTGTLVLGDGH